MDEKVEMELIKDFPKIFRQVDLPMTETCMCWGIECGTGWAWLIRRLCHSIQSYVDSRNEGVRIRNKALHKQAETEAKKPQVGFREIIVKEEEEWQVEAVQVKEKFGGLRFYISSGDDHVYGMIDLAESMSYHICENCGSTEDIKQTKGGWITSLCPKCMKISKKEPETQLEE